MQLSSIQRSASLSEQAYELIREAITSGALKLGERITERNLAQKLSISPTPVREALKRLEHEGLIERRGPKSLVVSGKSEAAIAEIVYIEAALLGIAARFAAAKISEDELGEIQALYEQAKRKMKRASGEEILQLARRFHEIVNQASRNEILFSFLKTVESFNYSHRLHSLNVEMQYKTSHLKDSLREHLRIYEALKTRNGELAERLMVKHSLRTSKIFFKHLNDKTKFG
jgi:DNA-binding GntR family transcriptional regulator